MSFVQRDVRCIVQLLRPAYSVATDILAGNSFAATAMRRRTREVVHIPTLVLLDAEPVPNRGAAFGPCSRGVESAVRRAREQGSGRGRVRAVLHQRIQRESRALRDHTYSMNLAVHTLGSARKLHVRIAKGVFIR